MELTRAEEQVMQILWNMGEGLVRDIRECFPEPKPARNTVSTIVRILERKGFVAYRDQGNAHIYYPLVSKDAYSKKQLFSLMKNYFNNSFPAMASFFAREKDLTAGELEELMEEAKKDLLQDDENKDNN